MRSINFKQDNFDLISNYHVVKDATKVRLLTGLRRDEVASAAQAGAGDDPKDK
jgi:hypothetical protein